MPQLDYIPLNQIRQSKVALRDVNRQSEDFMELTQSIRSQGVLAAISVRRVPGEDGKQFQLVDGLQRFTASSEVGTGVVEIVDGKAVGTFVDGQDAEGKPIKIGVIPAQIIDRDEADTMVSQIIANAHRIETKPTEYAKAIIRFLGYNPVLTEAELAVKLGKSPAWIGKTLTLNKLADAAKPLVDDGHIVLVNAYNLAKLPPDEQLLWLDRAQTQKPDEFTAGVLKRAKEIRDANKQGRDAAAETFTPVRHIRKKPELESEADAPKVGPALIRELDLTSQFKPNAQGLFQAASAGFQLGLNWAMNYDPKSQQAQKEKDENRRKSEAETKIRRDAEKKNKAEAEAIKRAEKARTDAAAAREAAAKLPPVLVTESASAELETAAAAS